MMPIKILTEFGLSEKEAKIYIYLLEYKEAKISDIAKKSAINRTSLYVILEELAKKEIVTVSIGKRGIQHYTAVAPEVLLRQAENKAKRQKEIRDKIEKIIPELRAFHKEIEIRPRIYVYNGQDAIKQAYYDIYDEQVLIGMKKFRVYEDLSNVKKFLPPDFIKKDVLDIKKSGAIMYAISPDNNDSRDVIDDYKKFGSNDKFITIPENKFNRTKRPVLSFSIYENKIDFLTKDSFLVVIESSEIADALKNLFDLAWKEAENLNKQK